MGSSSCKLWPQDRPLGSTNVARKRRLRTGNFSCGLRTGHLVLQTNVVREAACGSCSLRTVNLCGLITSEYVSVVRECPTRVLHKSPQECPTRVSCKSVPQSDESVARECPTRAFYKSVSYKSVKKCLGVCFRVRVFIRARGLQSLSKRRAAQPKVLRCWTISTSKIGTFGP